MKKQIHIQNKYCIDNVNMFVLFFLLVNILLSQNIESPINGKTIIPHHDNYSIMIAGHIYGSPLNPESVFPSASILGMLKEINEIDLSFFVSLGDNIIRTTDIQINNYKKYFANQLNFPIFNAVGNHDVTNRQKYEEYFGKTTYDFTYGSELYIFLDSELEESKIIGEQLNYFISLVKQKALNLSIKNIFIFSHKLIWAANIPQFQIVYKNLNNPNGYKRFTEFQNVIMPLLKDIAKEKNVYWISGDIGTSWSLPLFFDNENNSGITFIATGLGDNERDLVLKVDIMHGDVKFSTIPLGNNEGYNVEFYDLQYWDKYYSRYFGSHFFTTYIPKFNRIIVHRYFYLGLFIGVFALLFILLVLYFSKNRVSV